MKAITGGGERTTPVITACMSRSWKVEVCQKKKNATGRRNDRSAISSKEHVKFETTQPYFCQLRTNTTACTWPANDYNNGARDHNNKTARHPPKSLLGEKKHQKRYDAIRDEDICHSLVSSVDTVDFYCDLRVAQLNSRRSDYFSPDFLCRKCMVHPRFMP